MGILLRYYEMLPPWVVMIAVSLLGRNIMYEPLHPVVSVTWEDMLTRLNDTGPG